MINTTIEQHIQIVRDAIWHLQAVLRRAEMSALNRLRSEVGDCLDCEEINGDLYKIGECIKNGARRGEGYFLARRYKANGELADYDSQVRMHYEPRDIDPDEGDYEEWEVVEEFHDNTEGK